MPSSRWAMPSTRSSGSPIPSRCFGASAGSSERYLLARMKVPRDFDIVDIPFPEKGAPTVHRLDGEPVPV